MWQVRAWDRSRWLITSYRDRVHQQETSIIVLTHEIYMGIDAVVALAICKVALF